YSTFAFGDIGSTMHIDARASKQRKQTSFSYAYSNRSYDHRLMLTHSTGMSKHGWAFTFSGSRRYADEGYVQGTYYNGWSYFAAVDKRLGQKNLLSFVAIGAPTENGRQGAAVAEMQELAGSRYYNPYWGFQNGKKRNSNVAKTHQPVFILSHDLRINNNTSLVTAVGFITGTRSISGIDWYNAPDPRPDYYRYLPSYQTDPALQQQVADYLRNNESARQINWDGLYDVNRNNIATINNANGIQGNSVTGQRSLYIVQERVTKTQRINVNSVFNTRISDHVNFTGGASYQSQKNSYYQKVNDLLGGEFYVDLNQFAERTFPNDNNAIQNDLNRPNRILKAGDEYGYNYDIDITRAAGWAQGVFRFTHVDFYVAGEVSQNKFWRVGNVRNGLFPDNSYGKGTVSSFTNYAAKAGLTYKINGRNYVYVSGAYLTRPPYFENAYISARTRDILQDDLESEVVKTVEGGYIMNSPKVKLRIGGYYTMFEHGFNVLTFYHETYRNFVNYAISNIDKLHFGGEFGFEAKLVRNITVTGAAAVGRYYYNSRQHAITSLDNTAEILDSQTVYSQNFRIPSTPQEAYSLGFTYRSPKFWFVSLTGNYFDQMWLDFNPIRRTTAAVDGLDPKSSQWHTVIDQTEFDPQMTLDFFGGYSWKVPNAKIDGRQVYVAFNVGVNNILNNKDIVTGGYEQLRFPFDTKNPNEFPPKLFYAYGTNFFMSVSVRF
ncbi:MAG TPA: TonB-dependent receptor, partial [Chitinophagaceae bacterium]|nr:TonB-dependent receptor [Chitinophagaceae bacterium]